MWTREDLHKLIKDKMGDYLFIMVSNREPYIHVFKEGKVECMRPAGGMVTALDPVMRACNGIWVAHGSGKADRKVVDAKGRIRVPPGNPEYTLRRVWLSKEEESGYYYGFSNQALWPLCHLVYTRPTFNEVDWQIYEKVNRIFAEAVLEEIGDRKAFVWIQDYHLALLPRLLKEKNPDIITAHFWHIPWPNPEAFRICPTKKEILKGLLANDILGFHIRYHCDNFLETVEKELEARVDREKPAVIHKGHETMVRAFPISVDFEAISKEAASVEVNKKRAQLREEFGVEPKMKVILGIDRIDYTKGIPDRLKAIGRFLEKYPSYKEKVVFIQIGALSRIHIPAYKDLNDEINNLVEEINWKYSTEAWFPVIFVRRHLSYKEILACYGLADICIVSSLHDGMNIVAKEYVAAKSDLDGVVLLSQFTGASRELQDAILINPYDTDKFAAAIRRAIDMPRERRVRRMKKLRDKVKENNIYKWAGKFISRLLKL